MTQLYQEPNVLKGTHQEGIPRGRGEKLTFGRHHFTFSTSFQGLLELLNDMNTRLEMIQRSLDMYLETKRQHFPRFYFISNDDLLEILGQAKNPVAVSK